MDIPYSQVAKQVSDALINDPRMKGCVIDVTCQQGFVTLTGTVKKPAMSQTAEEIARSQPGVISVVNEIKVGR